MLPAYPILPDYLSIGDRQWTAHPCSLEDINSSGNCTAIIIAAITYWQSKEINTVIKEKDPEAAGVDISLLAYVSPIEWSYVILYGEYKLNRDLVK